MTYSSTSQTFVEVNEPVVEIYSEHGFCENLSSDRTTNSDFEFSNDSYYIRKSLQIGKKFGFTASGGYASRPGYYLC